MSVGGGADEFEARKSSVVTSISEFKLAVMVVMVTVMMVVAARVEKTFCASSTLDSPEKMSEKSAVRVAILHDDDRRLIDRLRIDVGLRRIISGHRSGDRRRVASAVGVGRRRIVAHADAADAAAAAACERFLGCASVKH